VSSPIAASPDAPIIILVMGVSGSGKTTIGLLLAQQLGWQFADADSFHSAENIAKMRQGIPLTDRDRQPWLAALRQAIEHWLETKTQTVLACSALKAEYRQFLRPDPNQIQVIYLKGDPNLIQHRLEQRYGHYMKADLLESQFAALEEPDNALVVDVTQPPSALVTQIQRALALD
jgi:gluconokinase